MVELLFTFWFVALSVVAFLVFVFSVVAVRVVVPLGTVVFVFRGCVFVSSLILPEVPEVLELVTPVVRWLLIRLVVLTCIWRSLGEYLNLRFSRMLLSFQSRARSRWFSGH